MINGPLLNMLFFFYFSFVLLSALCYVITGDVQLIRAVLEEM